MNLRAYYSSSIHDFLTMDAENILGSILIHNEFETTDLQKTLGVKKFIFCNKN